jgi:hypothetical protein
MKYSNLWIFALASAAAVFFSACGDDDHAGAPDTDWPTDTNTYSDTDTDTDTDGDTDSDSDTDTDTDTDSDADTTVPDVVGMTEAAARTAIEAADLKVEVSYECNGAVPIGTVISQDPEGGTVVNVGSTVAIAVSGSGPLMLVINDPPFDYVVSTSNTVTVSGLSQGNMDMNWSGSLGGGGSITPGASWEADVSLVEFNNKITVTGAGECGESPLTDNVTITYSDTTVEFLDRVIVEPHEMFTGDSDEVRVQIALKNGTDTIKTDSVRVVELNASLVVGDTIAPLRDDGNAETGDDVMNDGTYSGVFELTDTSVAKLYYFQAAFEFDRPNQTVGTAYSEVFTVEVVQAADRGDIRASLEFTRLMRAKYSELRKSNSEEQARKLTLDFVKSHTGVTRAAMSGSGIWRELKSGQQGIMLFDGSIRNADIKQNKKKYEKLEIISRSGGQRQNDIPLGNPLAVIYSPFYSEYSAADVAFEDDVQALLEQNECPPYKLSGINYLRGEEAGVEAFRQMSKNGLVIIHTRSAIVYFKKYGRNEVVLLTGQQVGDSPTDDIAMDLAQDRLVSVNYGGADYYAITSRFILEYGQYPSFPESLVYLGADDTAYRDTYSTPTYMVENMLGRGAKAVFAVKNIAQGTPIEQVFLNNWSKAMFSRFIVEKENTYQANAGAYTDLGASSDSNGSHVNLFGGTYGLVLPFATGVVNPSFEEMIQLGWAKAGDARTIGMLGPFLPKEGNKMAIVSTGLGSVNSSNSYFGQGFCVPEGVNHLNFAYDVVSEEPMEWITEDEQFDDKFQAIIVINDDLENATIIAEESVNGSTWTPDGGLPNGPDGGVNFQSGDDTIYHTGWNMENLVAVQPGDSVYVEFRVWDVGDSLYDTAALIDKVQLVSGESECQGEQGCASEGEWCDDGWCANCNSDDHCGGACEDCTASACDYGHCDDGYQECWVTEDFMDSTCVDCAAPGDCYSGYWCSANQCAACIADNHCGLSCLDCNSQNCVAGNCDDGTRECVATTSEPSTAACVDCEYDSDCTVHFWCHSDTCMACGDYDDHCGTECANCAATVCASGNCDDEYQVCNVNTCVECVVDDDCAGGHYCNAGTCAACADIDEHCGSICEDCTAIACDGASCVGGTKVCNGTGCVDCVLDVECVGDAVCNSYNQCVECEYHSDCSNGEYCNAETSACESCNIETNCGGSGVAPPCTNCAGISCGYGYCDGSPGYQECDVSTLTCEDCVYDADCTGGYWCDTGGADNKCTQCNTEAHCGSTCQNCGQVDCVYGNCDNDKQECTGTICVDCVYNTDCKTGFMCDQSNKKCVPMECDSGGGAFAWFDSVCWYYGAQGQSCDDACLAHGSFYNEKTMTFAGSAGTNPNCLNICNALGVPGDLVTTGSANAGVGCYYDSNSSARHRQVTPTTTSSATYTTASRICACETCDLDTKCGAGCVNCTAIGCPSCAVDTQTCKSDGSGCVQCEDDLDCDSGYLCQNNSCVLDCLSGGVEAAGLPGTCWYSGALGENCDTVCGNASGLAYGDATKTYAGSGGTDAQCQEVMTALGQSGSVTSAATGLGLGCGRYQSGYNGRDTDATLSTASDSSFSRACACREPGSCEGTPILNYLEGAGYIFKAEASEEMLSQLFVGDGSTLSSFKLLLSEGSPGVAGDHTIVLYNEDTSTIIAAWYTGDIPSDGYSYSLCFALSTPTRIETGVNYSINLIPNSGVSPSKYIAMDVFDSNVYAGGSFWYFDGVNWYEYTDNDAAFALWGKWCADDGDCDTGYWCNGNACEQCNLETKCGTGCDLDCTDGTHLCAGGNCDDANQECSADGFGCVDCNIDEDCATGNWCSSGTCIACGDYDANCGSSCTDCTGVACAGNNCDDGYQVCAGDTCVDCVEHIDCAAEYGCDDTNQCVFCWGETTVAGEFNTARSVYAADMDNDGDMDMLGAASGDVDDITWFENTAGDGSAWTEHVVNGDFDGATSVSAADMDKDGDMDVLGAAYNLDDVTWWENTDGVGTAWTEHTVNGDFGSVKSVSAADMDKDGDMDVLGAASTADDIIWWENTAGNGTAWTGHTVDGDFDGARWVFAADMDKDGDLDVLGAGYDADEIAWWENTAGNGTAWTKHAVAGSFDGARTAFAADMDKDGDLDVLGAASGTADDITWWENTNGVGTAWTEHTVVGNFLGAYSAYAADMDNDGDLDVVGAAYDDDDITWFENTAGDGTAWTEHIVDGEFDGASEVYVADIDDDGDMDVLGAAETAGDITWWENLCTEP